MGGVLVGYLIIGSIILVGYLIERSNLLGQDVQAALNRLVFFVCTPALLFTVLAHADIKILFSDQLTVGMVSMAVIFVLYLIIAKLSFRKKKSVDLIFGAASSSYVNSNNIGLPVAIYMLGAAEFAAPVLMFQVVLATPVLLLLISSLLSGKMSWKEALLQPVKNPIILASILGVLIGYFQVPIPEPIFEPFEIIGGAAIPLILMSFGMSLRGRKALGEGSPRGEIILASALKLVAMPLVAWVFGYFVLGMSGHELYAAVVIAALPTAQNVYNYSVRYNRSILLTRDTALITTVLSFPVLLLIAYLLA